TRRPVRDGSAVRYPVLGPDADHHRLAFSDHIYAFVTRCHEPMSQAEVIHGAGRVLTEPKQVRGVAAAVNQGPDLRPVRTVAQAETFVDALIGSCGRKRDCERRRAGVSFRHFDFQIAIWMPHRSCDLASESRELVWTPWLV